jgi:hypothetical protein
MFVLLAVVGWAVVVVLAYYVARARRELRRVREATHAAEDVALVEAITETERESADRVARAEAVQHWLLAALDEATDAIVVVDRIGREIVRNAPADSTARHGEVSPRCDRRAAPHCTRRGDVAT